MSMLTPPGMGGKYKITGNAYPRMRRPRRRRKLLGAVALLTTAGVLGWGTLQLFDVFTGQHKADAAQRPRCDTAKGSAGDGGTPAGGNPRAAEPTGAAGSPKPSASGSPQQAGGLPEPDTITVNVLNATSRTNLAKRTSEVLAKRGFKLGKVGNPTGPAAEYDHKVEETALLVGGPKSAKALRVLGTHLSGTRTKVDDRKDASVDMILGKAFKQLDTPVTARKALTALVKPSPSVRADAKGC